ncbi:MAG: YbjN domain-containing protein [Clostridia bacterium]|nr:YbjN domain-containing protein [Clostridia bacterium]
MNAIDRKKHAKKTFESVLAMLDGIQLHYTAEEEDLSVHLKMTGDDFTLNVFIVMDEDRELVRFFVRPPFDFPEERRILGAKAAADINNRLIVGTFHYTYEKGGLLFEDALVYGDTILSKEVLERAFRLAVHTVDDNIETFFGLAKGLIDYEEFLARID